MELFKQPDISPSYSRSNRGIKFCFSWKNRFWVEKGIELKTRLKLGKKNFRTFVTSIKTMIMIILGQRMMKEVVEFCCLKCFLVYLDTTSGSRDIARRKS